MFSLGGEFFVLIIAGIQRDMTLFLLLFIPNWGQCLDSVLADDLGSNRAGFLSCEAQSTARRAALTFPFPFQLIFDKQSLSSQFSVCLQGFQ